MTLLCSRPRAKLEEGKEQELKKVGWDAGWLNTKVNRSIDCIGDLLLSVVWDCPVTSFIPRDEGQRTTVDGPRGSGGLARVGSASRNVGICVRWHIVTFTRPY